MLSTFLSFVAVFLAFLIAVWVPVGLVIWKLDRLRFVPRYVYQFAAIVGGIFWWMTFHVINRTSSHPQLSLGKVIFYLIATTWSLYLFGIAFTIGFLVPKENLSAPNETHPSN